MIGAVHRRSADATAGRRRRPIRTALLAIVALLAVSGPWAGLPPVAEATDSPAAQRQAAFHRAATQDFLGRRPRAAEINVWVSRLHGGGSRVELLRALAFSDEWIGHVVDRFYRDTLGRGPDPSGRAYWIGRLRSGALTPAQVAGLFYASDEYFGRSGGDVGAWVDDLYRALLDRDPDAAGRAYWIHVARTRGRPAVSGPFYQSMESRERRVTLLYRALLSRGPDPDGRRFWADRIGQTGNDLTLAMSLAASDEYVQKAQRRFPPPNAVWVVGAVPLPRRADGFGQVRPTPSVLVDRALPTRDRLPPPSGGFESSIRRIDSTIRQRMGRTWRSGCPVPLSDLRYVRVSFVGFDGGAHTGELVVHQDAARDIVSVFRRLFNASYPIEEMRLVTGADLDAHPTGDGNNTAAFVCRPVTAGNAWSQHAYGLAIDINPFHNPYRRGDLVLPELASSYLDRSPRPGVIRPSDVVVDAFAAIGWEWGGDWGSVEDYQHFSRNGR